MKKLWMWGGLFAVLTLAVAALLWIPKIQRVVIELPENSPIEAQALAALLAPYEGNRFLQLPLEEVQHQLKKHPWVAWAHVRKVWPGTLVVQVQPQVPVARWGETGLVNAQGEVFYPKHIKAFVDLLPLWAPDPKEAPRLLRLGQWLMTQTAFLNWHLVAVTLHPGGSLETRWQPERTIWLKASDMEAQFSRFLVAWPQVKPALRDKAAEIDLRYSNGFTIK